MSGPLFSPGPADDDDRRDEAPQPTWPPPAADAPRSPAPQPPRHSSLGAVLGGRRTTPPPQTTPAPVAQPPVAEPATASPLTPASTELLPEDVYRIVNGHEVRDTPWTRLVEKTRSLLTSPPAKREEQLDHALEDLRLRGLTRGVTVALGSIKGGAGKTTITLTLADMLANALRVGVLVVDADLEWGTAADSVPQNARHGGTIVDVYNAREQIIAPGQLAPFLVNLPGGAQLLPGPTDPRHIEQIEDANMAELLALLRRFYPVILLDLPPGIGLRGTIPRWGFGEADEIIAVATPKRANVRQVGHMLSYLAEHHADVPLTLALNMVPMRPDQAAQRVISVAESNGRSRRYAAVPQDPTLERQLDAGVLDLPALDQRTRIALKELTYGLAREWCR